MPASSALTLGPSILGASPGLSDFTIIVALFQRRGNRGTHRCGNLKLHHLILWFWFSSTTQALSCALSSLVLTPPPKAPVFPGQVGRRNQGWLALIDCEEVKDAHLGSKLVFFYVRWG